MIIKMMLCTINQEKFLDYNNDDYYDHGLDNCPDLKNSEFLKELL